MDFERYNNPDWAATCGISGLRIAPGEAVRLVVLDDDYTELTGPCFCGSPVTHPVEAVYLGEGKVALSGGLESAEVDLFVEYSGIEYLRPENRGYMTDNDRGDRYAYLISEKIWSGLESLTDDEQDTTLGKRADERYKSMLRDMLPYTASETHDREHDEGMQNTLWSNYRSDHREYPELYASLESMGASEQDLALLLRAERDSYLLWLVNITTGRPLVPSMRLSFASNDAVVSDLARLVRRKAMHSVMADA